MKTQRKAGKLQLMLLCLLVLSFLDILQGQVSAEQLASPYHGYAYRPYYYYPSYQYTVCYPSPAYYYYGYPMYNYSNYYFYRYSSGDKVCYSYYYPVYSFNNPYEYYTSNSYPGNHQNTGSQSGLNQASSQYQISIASNLSASNNDIEKTGLYSAGAQANISAPQIVPGSKGIRYVFDHWSGDAAGTSPSMTVAVDSNKNLVANYKTQYYLSVIVKPEQIVSTNGEGWYDEGQTARISISARIIDTGQGVRYLFDGWQTDTGTSTSPTIEIKMNEAKTVTLSFKKQYYLDVESERGNHSDAGWYDAGTTATISIEPSVKGELGVSYQFNEWQGSIQSSSPTTTIMMDGPKTISASWKPDRTLQYIGLAILSVAIIGVAAAMRHSRSMKSLSQINPELIMRGKLCISCGSTIQKRSRFCSECGSRQS